MLKLTLTKYTSYTKSDRLWPLSYQIAHIQHRSFASYMNTVMVYS